MRALRIFLILVIVLGGLFVIADRVAVNFAEDQAADRIKSTEGLANTPTCPSRASRSSPRSSAVSWTT